MKLFHSKICIAIRFNKLTSNDSTNGSIVNQCLDRFWPYCAVYKCFFHQNIQKHSMMKLNDFHFLIKSVGHSWVTNYYKIISYKKRIWFNRLFVLLLLWAIMWSMFFKRNSNPTPNYVKFRYQTTGNFYK